MRDKECPELADRNVVHRVLCPICDGTGRVPGDDDE